MRGALPKVADGVRPLTALRRRIDAEEGRFADLTTHLLTESGPWAYMKGDKKNGTPVQNRSAGNAIGQVEQSRWLSRFSGALALRVTLADHDPRRPGSP